MENLNLINGRKFLHIIAPEITGFQISLILFEKISVSSDHSLVSTKRQLPQNRILKLSPLMFRSYRRSLLYKALLKILHMAGTLENSVSRVGASFLAPDT